MYLFFNVGHRFRSSDWVKLEELSKGIDLNSSQTWPIGSAMKNILGHMTSIYLGQRSPEVKFEVIFNFFTKSSYSTTKLKNLMPFIQIWKNFLNLTSFDLFTRSKRWKQLKFQSIEYYKILYPYVPQTTCY